MTVATGATTPRTRTATGTFKAERTPGDVLTREELASMASDVLKKLHVRATADRFLPKGSDPEFLAMVRAFMAGVTALNGVIKDMEQEEVKDRLSRIEAALEIRERDRKYQEQIEREYAKMR